MIQYFQTYSEWLLIYQIQLFSRESMHKHNFGQNLILQSAVTLNIRSRSSKSNYQTMCMYLCKFGGNPSTGSEDKISEG